MDPLAQTEFTMEQFKMAATVGIEDDEAAQRLVAFFANHLTENANPVDFVSEDVAELRVWMEGRDPLDAAEKLRL